MVLTKSRNSSYLSGINSGNTGINFGGEAIPVCPLEVETPFEWHHYWSDGTEDL